MADSGIDRVIEMVGGHRRLVVSKQIGADRETVWDLLIDTDRWDEWGPSVRRVEYPDRYIEAGATGHIRTTVGFRFPFEITTCDNYRWTWRVARIPATGHRVQVRNGRTRVGFEIPLLAMGYAPVCVRALERIEEIVGEK